MKVRDKKLQEILGHIGALKCDMLSQLNSLESHQGNSWDTQDIGNWDSMYELVEKIETYLIIRE